MKLRRIYEINWIVEGSTGHTSVLANCKQEVEQYFKFNFERFGYKLISIN